MQRQQGRLRVTGTIERTKRGDYSRFQSISTRWMDNDVYGHVNNVVYYSWFDTAVNRLLVVNGLLDIHHGQTIGLVVETGCRYFAPTAFPDEIEAGVRVAHIGTSSVRYEIGLFRNKEPEAAAVGYFVHVYVDRDTKRPAAIDEKMRSFLEGMRP
ncbi:MAG: acyl-CoA thioesterase [Brevundimonas sp.]|nr:acyl-CoA thioesterase [Brevundimonas sp.]